MRRMKKFAFAAATVAAMSVAGMISGVAAQEAGQGAAATANQEAAATTDKVLEEGEKTLEKYYGPKWREHKFTKALGYYKECKYTSEEKFNEIKPYLRAFTDSVVMAETLNDPEKFFKLMEIINEPSTIHVMMNCMFEPVMWDTWMMGLTNYERLTIASLKLMNPVGMFKWMLAPINMNVWKSMLAHLDYNKYVRWFEAFLNPKFYRPWTDMLTSLDWYTPRLSWFVRAETYTVPLKNMVTLPSLERIYKARIN